MFKVLTGVAFLAATALMVSGCTQNKGPSRPGPSAKAGSVANPNAVVLRYEDYRDKDGNFDPNAMVQAAKDPQGNPVPVTIVYKAADWKGGAYQGDLSAVADGKFYFLVSTIKGGQDKGRILVQPKYYKDGLSYDVTVAEDTYTSASAVGKGQPKADPHPRAVFVPMINGTATVVPAVACAGTSGCGSLTCPDGKTCGGTNGQCGCSGTGTTGATAGGTAGTAGGATGG